MEELLNKINKLTLEDLDRLLLEINNRDDIYVEWINENDRDKEFIEKCKNYEYNLLNLDEIENQF